MSDAVIVEAVRSPGGRYKRGGLAETRSDAYGIQVIKGLMARLPEVNPAEIDDLIVGCSFPEHEQGMNMGRILAMGAGLPISCLRYDRQSFLLIRCSGHCRCDGKDSCRLVGNHYCRWL